MTAFVIFVIVVFVVGAFSGKGRCGVCNSPIKRKSYSWSIGGKTQKLCPSCSSRMDRKVSKAAFIGKFGK